MQKINLNIAASPLLIQQVEICIIGAGAAGIYLATRLAAQGKDVVIVEAGNATCVSADQIGMEIEFGEQYYSGAVAGRSFGLGGSTSRWGGALVPHIQSDQDPFIDNHTQVWQNIVGKVQKYSAIVLENLGFEEQPDFIEVTSKYFKKPAGTLNQAGITPMSTLFLPFKRKNFASLLDRNKQSLGKITLLFNAVVSEWSWSDKNSGTAVIQSCIAKSKTGQQATIHCKQYIIAAGAIESAKILLEIKQQSQDRLLRTNVDIGHYLSDHLSSRIADVRQDHWERTADIFGPRFSKGDMRSFRFIEKNKPVASPRSFFHFIFEIDNPGFSLAKKVLSGLQARRLPVFSPSEIVKGLQGAAALTYTRFIRNRLYIPKATPTHLQLDLEQTPSFSNRLELGKEKDIYGRQKEIIYWKIEDSDYQKIQNAGLRFLQKWPKEFHVFPELQFHRSTEFDTKPHDAYHPVGTCRMGFTVDSVVDENLKVRGLDNIFVLSTAVFPTAGSAHPTFSMLCLGESLATYIVSVFS